MLLAEALDDLLLVDVRERAVQNDKSVFPKLKIGREPGQQPFQGFDAFGENDQPVIAVLARPSRFGIA